ncbi:MAG: ParB/RepB/Spo0J family partition protein [Acholeplasmataceae bacterium]|jgi:ParB-like chromosome segregation protein Spo0J
MAYLTQIEAAGRYDRQHPTDPERVAALVAHVRSVGRWDLPPVVVVADEGNGYAILDGHHRVAAAEVLACDPERAVDAQTIPAYVVETAEYCLILDQHFGGICPNRLADLREYVDCDGRTADEVAN